MLVKRYSAHQKYSASYFPTVKIISHEIPAEKCSYRSIKKGNMFKAKTLIEKGGTRNLNQLT